MFALGYIRKVLAGEKLIHTSKLFEDVAKRNGFYTKELMEKVAEKGTAQVEGIPKKWQEVFKCANDISYRDHLLMQNELQKYCDSGISKTINMSSDATIEDIDIAYKLAYKSQYIKGTTVYRDKSREGAPINVGLVDYSEAQKEPIDIGEISAIDRPKRTEGGTTSYKSGCGKLYLTVNHDEEGIIETFAFTGSSGGFKLESLI